MKKLTLIIAGLFVSGISVAGTNTLPPNPLTFSNPNPDTVTANTVNSKTEQINQPAVISGNVSSSNFDKFFYNNDYSGIYIRAGAGFSNTTLTVDSAAHGTSLTGQANDKFALDVDLGYRFNKWLGAEVGYVDMGKPTFSLQRGWSDTGNGQSNLQVHNQSWILGVRGFAPIGETNFTATGRVAASFNSQSFNRSGDPSYSGNSTNTSVTVGLGGMYNFTKNLALIADVNYWPSMTPNTENSIQTSAFTVTGGLQWQF